MLLFELLPGGDPPTHRPNRDLARSPVKPLPMRKALAREVADMALLDRRLDWRISEMRLARDRVAQLKPLVYHSAGLDRTIRHLDRAVLALSQVRRALEDS